MSQASFALSCAVLTTLLVSASMVTDLLWRRIPNFLTLSALGLAILLRVFHQGWGGFGLALAGAVAAPALLLLMHGGKGLGMGDVKLAAAIGAVTGPLLGIAAMLVSMVAGGVMAVATMLEPHSFVSRVLKVTRIRSLSGKKKRPNDSPDTTPATIPYGVAIGVGSLLTLAVCWWTGHLISLLSYVETAANL